jgi:UDP-N-acetylglucosamine 3-dehydrogenase
MSIRVGILGCGKIAHIDHVPGYLRCKGAKVTALMDIKPSQMKALDKAFGLDAPHFTDLDAFLRSGLDAISICTPNYLHYPQTMKALKAGLNVLCEKPMAASFAEASRMVTASQRAGKVLQINQSLRYVALYQKIAETVAKGAIGEVIHIRCIRSGGCTPDVGWSPGATWFVSKKAQGGLILDIGVHMADLMRWITGEVSQVAAQVDTRKKGIDVPDNVTALMQFENGASGTLELSWTTPVGGNMLEVYGAKGTIRHTGGLGDPIELMKVDAKGQVTTTHPKPKAKVKHSQACFLDAILGKAPSPTPGDLGRDAVAMCEAIGKSGATGRFVKVKHT